VSVVTGAGLALAASASVAVAGRDPPAARPAATAPAVTHPPSPPTVTTPAGRPAWRVVALAGAAVAGLVGVAALVAAFVAGRNHRLNHSRREHT
jgi:hypothetical protein